MAKKVINSVEFLTKGELVGLDENIITTQITKKDEVIEDTIDLNEMMAEIEKFCRDNVGKNIEGKFLLRVTEE